MKVLQICAAYKPAYIYGGPTMSVSMLSEQLAIAGIEVAVYATTANGSEELPVKTNSVLNVDGVPVTYFARLTKDHTHFSPGLLKATWKQVKKYDLVHIHAWWNLVSVFTCLIAVIKQVPVVVSPRGTLSNYSFQNKSVGAKQLLHKLFGKYLLDKCYVHVTSQREKQAIARLINPVAISVIPNFVKLQARIEITAIPQSDSIRLLFFSRIEQKKGLNILLHALTLVTVPFTLTIAGSGDADYIESLKKIAKDSAVDDRIIWAGFYNADKFDLLSKHDLFILPSHDENFGNAVIESLSVGTAVLISEQVGLAGYVLENDLGWICQTTAQSVSGLVDQIAHRGSEKLNKIRGIAPGIIYNDFEENALTKKYVDFYAGIIKTRVIA